jgi:hypothetical protein
MAKQKYVNNFEWQFSAAVSNSYSSSINEAGYGTLQISQSAAAMMSALTGGDYYILTALKRAGSVESAIEVMKVTGFTAGGSYTTINVLRGQEGTTVQSYIVGDYVSMRFTKGSAEALMQPGDNLGGLPDAAAARGNLGLGTAALTNTGTGAANTILGNDARLTDSRAPTGAAGGVLSGTYPTPGFAVDMATQAELDAAVALKEPTVTATTITDYYRGNKTFGDFATAARAVVLTAIDVGTQGAVSAADTILAAIGKLQATKSSLTGAETLTNKTLTTPVINGYTEGVVTANTSTAYTIALTGTMQILTLTGNCAYTFPTPAAGKSFLLLQKQDATGSRTVTWPATVKWPNSTNPTLTATASKGDLFGFTSDGTYWYGRSMGSAYL